MFAMLLKEVDFIITISYSRTKANSELEMIGLMAACQSVLEPCMDVTSA
jgi:hypothetical protein